MVFASASTIQQLFAIINAMQIVYNGLGVAIY